jgi:hypothetical protein
MEALTFFLLPSFLGLVLGAGSRYLGFCRNWARSLPTGSHWFVILLIQLWIVAPLPALFLIGFIVFLPDFDESSPIGQAVPLGIGIALVEFQSCIAFAIGWLAGPEADRPYRPRNPFQEGVPPVFLFQPKQEDDDNWLDFPMEKEEAAKAAGSR